MFSVNYGMIDGQWVAVIPSLHGFIIREKSESDMKKEVVRVLRVYMRDESLTGKDIEWHLDENTVEKSNDAGILV